MLSREFDGVPVVILNDADAALSAELWGRAGQGQYDNVRFGAIITLGTGVGVALLLNGQFYQGCSGTIEGGHMIVNCGAEGRPCGCGQVVHTFMCMLYSTNMSRWAVLRHIALRATRLRG